jgi:ADP-ribosylglycohydrolase
MIGAIAGDIIGSVYERHNIKVANFSLFSPGSTFTDDSVLTVAIADAILSGTGYAGKLREYYRLYPERGYGPGFRRWAAAGRSTPYNSNGNGSAMRVSPIGFAFNTMEDVLREAKRSAEVTHNHPEGIKGAQAVAAAVFLARTGSSKEEIKAYIRETFGYTLSEPLDGIRTYYSFDMTCEGSVPQAITAFLESEGYEDAVRKAISIGGDSDTIACMAGGIAEAFYRGVPADITDFALAKLDDALREVIAAFERTYKYQQIPAGKPVVLPSGLVPTSSSAHE